MTLYIYAPTYTYTHANTCICTYMTSMIMYVHTHTHTYDREYKSTDTGEVRDLQASDLWKLNPLPDTPTSGRCRRFPCLQASTVLHVWKSATLTPIPWCLFISSLWSKIILPSRALELDFEVPGLMQNWQAGVSQSLFLYPQTPRHQTQGPGSSIS